MEKKHTGQNSIQKKYNPNNIEFHYSCFNSLSLLFEREIIFNMNLTNTEYPNEQQFPNKWIIEIQKAQR
jgi:hypothetical protein